MSCTSEHTKVSSPASAWEAAPAFCGYLDEQQQSISPAAGMGAAEKGHRCLQWVNPLAIRAGC